MSELKTIIDANIKENGNQEITGKTMNYVLNKIAEGTQKDWNESDATNVEYIKGRTHGVTYEHVSVEGTLKELGYVPGEYVSVLHYARVNGVLEGKGLYLGGLLYNPIVGEEYRVKYEGPSVYARVVEVEDGYDVQIKGASDTGNLLKVAIVEYKKIDDAYISMDIARKSQVDALEQKVDNLPQGEEFDKEGNYPLLHVGTADDLAGRGESVPASFGFRASGGKSIKDGRAYIKAIKGNSVVWNQGIENVLSGSTSVRAWFPRRGLDYASIENGEITLSFDAQSDAFGNSVRQRVNVKAGDKFFIAYDYESHNVDEFGRRMFIAFTSGWSTRGGLNDASNAKGGDVTGHVEAIDVVPSRDDIDSICFYFCYTGITSPDTTPLKVSKFRFVNLTKMFGVGNEPTTIDEFNARKPIVEDEYAYNEGEVIHCNTESIKSVGDNAWDEEWEVGTLGPSGNVITSYDKAIHSKNFIKVVQSKSYQIKVPYTGSGARIYVCNYDANKSFINRIGLDVGELINIPNGTEYIKFATDNNYNSNTYKNDICISLVHSGWKQDTDAGYQPYWQDTLPLPIISKYFPQGMKKAGTAHDEIRFNKASGKWEYTKSKTGGGKIKSVDLGAFDWKTDGVASGMEGVRYESLTKLDNCVHVTASVLPNILCAKYASVTANDTYRLVTGISLKSAGTLSLADTTIADVNALKASLQSVILYYECNDWEWVELDAEDQNFRDYYNVADFGTEQAIPAKDAEGNIIPSANFSADIIYQFNAVDMIREHELEITELQKVIATMQAQLASLTNS